MIFTDLRFLLLFACCWVSFFAVPRSWRRRSLALWGTIFYFAYAGPSRSLSIVLVDRHGFLAPESASPGSWAAAVCVLLAFFKVVGNVELLSSSGADVASMGHSARVSYLSFELLHVIVERRRGRIASVRFLDSWRTPCSCHAESQGRSGDFRTSWPPSNGRGLARKTCTRGCFES